MERISFESVVTTICEVYGYRLGDIYQKGFREGGLTQGQIEVLFESYQERHYNQMVFEAGCHGINLNEVSGKKTVETSSVFEFKSPEEYDKMSEEEKQELTRKMMGKHKSKLKLG